MTTLGPAFYTSEDLAAWPFASIGRNVQVSRTARLCFVENIAIGDNSRIDDFAVIVASRERVNIGRYCHIASQVYVSGAEGFEMGDFCGLSPGAKVFTASDDYVSGLMTNSTVPVKYRGGPAGRVTFEPHVIVGAGAVIMPCVPISEGCSVGALSLVRNNLPPAGIYAGIPARRIRERNVARLRKLADKLVLDEMTGAA